jgi:hypothetical protein
MFIARFNFAAYLVSYVLIHFLFTYAVIGISYTTCHVNKIFRSLLLITQQHLETIVLVVLAVWLCCLCHVH